MMTTTVVGGALIGASAGALFLVEGRIAGVSGTLAGAFRPAQADRTWRLAFIAGLVLGGAAVQAMVPGALPASYDAATWRIVVAGVLVGGGARLANGCTSGHGLCGVARGSSRSVAAVATFVVCGMLTVLAMRHLGGW